MINTVGNKCSGCGACSSICPQNCISMTENREGFLYPQVNMELCVRCGQCDNVCPVIHNNCQVSEPLEETWSAAATDKTIVFESSSGGIFTLLANQVLQTKGVVFGAAFSDDFSSVHHTAVKEEKGLHRLRSSKYIQSITGNSFSETKTLLENGKKVLFSGTPCQIAGLKNYLGRDHDNLLCADVICHGTPPAVLWQKYLAFLQKPGNGRITAVNFRNKEKGWRNFGLKIEYENSGCYYKSMETDPYIRLFLKNFCLRESCYQCAAKQNGPVSDITIGDFWGIEKTAPGLDNNRGISLVIIHTQKGKTAFLETGRFAEIHEVPVDPALPDNAAYRNSIKRPQERDLFFTDLNTISWKALEKKYIEAEIVKNQREKRLTAIRDILVSGLDHMGLSGLSDSGRQIIRKLRSGSHK